MSLSRLGQHFNRHLTTVRYSLHAVGVETRRGPDVGDLLTFPARQEPCAQARRHGDRGEVRAALKHALETTLDAADMLIAQLDGLDGDPDREPGGDEEPSLAAPIGGSSQVPRAAGGSHDLEQALTRLGRACRAIPQQETMP